jgi:hypothetical protein
MMGGTGPADAATEVFARYLAKEIGPRGVGVVGLWTAGVRRRRSANETGAGAGWARPTSTPYSAR